MLELKGINAGYGDVQVLFDLDLTAHAGQILCLLGRNGAGKTTTLRTIMGLVQASDGQIVLDDETISTLPPEQVARRGVGYVPQGRRLFTELTVAQNIEIGLMARPKGAGSAGDTRERVLGIFPRLRERLNQRSGTLSGGEQQMLATARALCLEPRVLLLDEPTEGLQPSMIDSIREVIVQMKRENVAVILVEQRIDAVLSLADRVAFIENGRNAETVDASTLHDDKQKIRKYLGV